jgi:hypothetical protein
MLRIQYLKWIIPISYLLCIPASSANCLNADKITHECAMQSHKETYNYQEKFGVSNAQTEENKNAAFAKPPENHSSNGGVIEEFTIDSNTGVNPKKLRPTATHICTLGQVAGEYHRGVKAIDVRVQKNSSDGYWYLFADGYSTHNYGKAICWSK